MWHASGDSDVRINETGIWEEIPGLALKIVLPEPASVRVLYSMSVMPDNNFGAAGKAAGVSVHFLCHLDSSNSSCAADIYKPATVYARAFPRALGPGLDMCCEYLVSYP